MSRFAIVLTIALLFGCVAWPQTASRPTSPSQPVKKSPLAGYAGAWNGNFEGRPWLTVQLTLQGGQLSGFVRRAHDLQFNDAGEIKTVSEDQITETLTDATINGDGLLLTTKNPDTNETDRFTMRLTSENTAELKMSAMTMPPGMPKLRPWKLTKVAASSPPPR